MFEGVQNALVLGARNEFELAKLHRLKTARRIKLVPELEKADLRHGFEQMDLSDEHFFDADHGAQAVICAECPPGIQPFDAGVHLVQDLLEPKLISLMDDDKKQLVVAGGFGQGRLELYQLGDLEILVIGKRGVLAVFG